ncbi:MAG: hypothetical protein CMN85_10950 [Spongiibacteraceae bacterium]|nr:hypothetical protein [Spongiibacteraceae bacterium]
MSIGTTRERLTAWGRWQRHGQNLGLSYKSPAEAMIRLKLGAGVGEPPVCDDDALFVDRAIARLKHRDGDLYEVLFLSYVYSLGSREIGKRLHRDHKWAQRMLFSAECWVDGRLDLVAA